MDIFYEYIILFYSLDMSTSHKSIYKLTIFKTYQLAGWLCLYAYVTYIQNLEEQLYLRI